MRIVSSAFVATLCTALGFAADPEVPVDARQGYRFVVKAEGGGSIAIRGLITVDGKDRVVDRAETPFQFGCEAGSVISGYFESLDARRRLRLLVYDPAYSKRRAAVRAKRWDRVRFSWAQHGAGPRCLDQGNGACPDTTPSLDELQRRLESLRSTSRDG